MASLISPSVLHCFVLLAFVCNVNQRPRFFFILRKPSLARGGEGGEKEEGGEEEWREEKVNRSFYMHQSSTVKYLFCSKSVRSASSLWPTRMLQEALEEVWSEIGKRWQRRGSQPYYNTGLGHQLITVR